MTWSDPESPLSDPGAALTPGNSSRAYLCTCNKGCKEQFHPLLILYESFINSLHGTFYHPRPFGAGGSWKSWDWLAAGNGGGTLSLNSPKGIWSSQGAGWGKTPGADPPGARCLVLSCGILIFTPNPKEMGFFRVESSSFLQNKCISFYLQVPVPPGVRCSLPTPLGPWFIFLVFTPNPKKMGFFRLDPLLFPGISTFSFLQFGMLGAAPVEERKESLQLC